MTEPPLPLETQLLLAISEFTFHGVQDAAGKFHLGSSHHRAELVLARIQPLIDEALATAWDRGFEQFQLDHQRMIMTGSFRKDCVTPNPYRPVPEDWYS